MSECFQACWNKATYTNDRALPLWPRRLDNVGIYIWLVVDRLERLTGGEPDRSVLPMPLAVRGSEQHPLAVQSARGAATTAREGHQ